MSSDDDYLEEGEDMDAYYERQARQMEAARRIVKPEPGRFQPPSTVAPHHPEQAQLGADAGPPKAEGSVDLKRDFGAHGLQIIVKLANIHLTPEKPTYSGGSWHVEGQMVRTAFRDPKNKIN